MSERLIAVSTPARIFSQIHINNDLYKLSSKMLEWKTDERRLLSTQRCTTNVNTSYWAYRRRKFSCKTKSGLIISLMTIESNVHELIRFHNINISLKTRENWSPDSFVMQFVRIFKRLSCFHRNTIWNYSLSYRQG